MLEVEISHELPFATLKLFLDADPILGQPPPIELPLKNGRMTKRLIHSPKWFQRVRIQPIDGDTCAWFGCPLGLPTIVWLSAWSICTTSTKGSLNLKL